MMIRFRMLYLIEILHQTTTSLAVFWPLLLLYLIEILHQTTTAALHPELTDGCILLKFYIKPQRYRLCHSKKVVVSY